MIPDSVWQISSNEKSFLARKKAIKKPSQNKSIIRVENAAHKHSSSFSSAHYKGSVYRVNFKEIYRGKPRESQPSLELLKEVAKYASESQKQSSLQKDQEISPGYEQITHLFKKQIPLSKMNFNGLQARKELYKHGMLVAVVQKPLSFKKLSKKSRKLLQDLDEWIVELESDGSVDETESTHLSDTTIRAQGAKRKVYVSYERKSQYHNAQQIVEYLQGLEEALDVQAYYTPLNSDDSDECIKNKIDSADLFIAVVDSFYGHKGSLSGLELEYAIKQGQSHPFFILSVAMESLDSDLLTSHKKALHSTRTLMFYEGLNSVRLDMIARAVNEQLGYAISN